MSNLLPRFLRVSLVAMTLLGAGMLLAPWVLYAASSPFPGRFVATVALTAIVLREVFVSCLRMPKKVAVRPSKDWTVAAVGFAYLGVLYACLAEIHVRRRGFPALEIVLGGATLYVLGLWLRSAALRHLGEHWSVQLDVSENPDRGLVRSGPYAWIRHPVYLAAMLESLGIALFFVSLVALAIAVLAFLPAELLRARFEERALLARMGERYREYFREVGGFVPRGRRRARPVRRDFR